MVYFGRQIGSTGLYVITQKATAQQADSISTQHYRLFDESEYEGLRCGRILDTATGSMYVMNETRCYFPGLEGSSTNNSALMADEEDKTAYKIRRAMHYVAQILRGSEE